MPNSLILSLVFSLSLVSLDSVAFVNIPLSPVNIAIVIPARIKSTIVC